MTKNSRLQKSAKNIKYSFLSIIIQYGFSFVTRTVFIYYLTIEFLGMNALIANILVILSMAESGLGGIFQYMLFKPLSMNKEYEVAAMMAVFKKIFIYISGVTFILGLIILPVLISIVDIDDLSTFIIIYIIAIMSSSINYLVLPKRVLIQADQKKYIVISIRQFGTIIQYALQILILVFTQNFILFMLMQLVNTFLSSLLISLVVKRNYNLKIKSELDNSLKVELKNKVTAGFLHHLGFIINNGTDNILISSFLGLKTAGIYSNYLLIINVIRSAMLLVYDSIYASIGNKVNTESIEENFIFYKRFDFIVKVITGFSVISFSALLNPLISVWIGESFLLPEFTVLLVAGVFLVDYQGIRKSTLLLKNATGLFHMDKYFSLIEAAVNIVISLVLVNYIGLNGILIGTIASYYLVGFWIQPFILYRNYFNKKLLPHFLKELIYHLLLISTLLIVTFASKYFATLTIFDLLIKTTFVGLLTLTIIWIITCKMPEYSYFVNVTKKFIKRK